MAAIGLLENVHYLKLKMIYLLASRDGRPGLSRAGVGNQLGLSAIDIHCIIQLTERRGNTTEAKLS